MSGKSYALMSSSVDLWISLARLIITHLQKTTLKLALARAKLEYFLSIKENYCSANEGQRVMLCKCIIFLFLQKLYIFLQTWPHRVTDHGYSVHIEPYDLLWLSLKEADISLPLIPLLLQGSLCSWLSHWPHCTILNAKCHNLLSPPSRLSLEPNRS